MGMLMWRDICCICFSCSDYRLQIELLKCSTGQVKHKIASSECWYAVMKYPLHIKITCAPATASVVKMKHVPVFIHSLLLHSVVLQIKGFRWLLSTNSFCHCTFEMGKQKYLLEEEEPSRNKWRREHFNNKWRNSLFRRMICYRLLEYNFGKYSYWLYFWK